MTDNIEYEERFVCFLDILGFKDAIENPKHPVYKLGPNFFYRALSKMKEKPDDPTMENFIVTQFSDSVAISFPSSNYQKFQLYMLIKRIIDLQQALLGGALLTRGAITKGKLYHDDLGIIFGPALIESVQLENRANYPQVIIDHKLKADLESFEPSKSMITSGDGLDYIEYIICYPCNDLKMLQLIMMFIDLGLKHECQRVREKYQWVRKKFSQHEELLAILRQRAIHFQPDKGTVVMEKEEVKANLSLHQKGKEITMPHKSIHVVPNPKGGWDIKKGGVERRSGHEETKKDAVGRARELSRKQGAELVIHNKNGKIAIKNSHGNDPFPPRG